MDVPPLAGRTVAMSLGALPVSYVLNQVSAFSQCVFVHEDPGAGGRMRQKKSHRMGAGLGPRTAMQAEIPLLSR